MKTVLFLDKQEEELWASFLKYDFLLDEFKREGAFDLCEWNREGTCVHETVPDLPRAVSDGDQWQAVVVSDLRASDEELRTDPHHDNPFDFPECGNVGPGDPFEESDRPLVRLTQMLGGLPERSHVQWPEDRLDHEAAIALEVPGGPGTGAGPDAAFSLIERYRLGLPRPERIVCVTPRDVDEAFDAAMMQASCNARRAVREAATASAADPLAFSIDPDLLPTGVAPVKMDFWQRNGYPATARFVVYDRLKPAVRRGQDGSPELGVQTGSLEDVVAGRANDAFWFRFWMSVLALMTSSVSPSDLRAYTLFRMGAQIERAALEDVFAKRKGEWLAAIGAIDAHLEHAEARRRASEYVQNDLPDVTVSIPVTFDLVDQGKLLDDPEQVRLFKDDPESDLSVWKRQRKRISHEFQELLRAPRRALRNAAALFRSKGPVPAEELEDCVLNEHQKDCLEDELEAIEHTLACESGDSPFASDADRAPILKAEAHIRDEIAKRATRPAALAAIGVGVAAMLLGMLPFVFGLTGGAGFDLESLFVALGCCGALALVGVVTLVRMRSSLRKAYVAFNEAMRNVFVALSGEGKRLSQRVSSYGTFRKRWSVLERQWHLDDPSPETVYLETQRALLKLRICDLDRIAENCGLEVQAKPAFQADLQWRDIRQMIDDPAFYEMGSVRGARKEGNRRSGLGEAADMPYVFIERISLEPVRLER